MYRLYTEFCENRRSSFCVILLTNIPTNKRRCENITFLSEAINTKYRYTYKTEPKATQYSRSGSRDWPQEKKILLLGEGRSVTERRFWMHSVKTVELMFCWAYCSYVEAIKGSPQSCLRCQSKLEMSAGSRKVISMSLYGDDPRYTIGALRNAERLPVVFPGWRLRVYYREGSVLRQLVDRLRELGAELIDVTTIPAVSALSPMLWRFTAVDDPTVDVVLIRDADSRLSDRDAAAVRDWMSAPGRPAFHCVRDHPSHASFSVNGGLWGARRGRLLELLRGGRPLMPLLAGVGDRYVDDMRFLDEHVWTPLSTRSPGEIYCHDSVSCDRWVGAWPLAVPRRWPGEHVGQVFDAWSRPRQGDVDLLLNAGLSSVCSSAETRPT